MAKYRLDSIGMPDGNEFEIPVFVAEYGVTPYEEVLAAYNDGKALFCVKNGLVFVSSGYEGYFEFILASQGYREYVNCAVSDGSTLWTSGSYKNIAYPSAYVSLLSSNYIAVATSGGMLNRSSIAFGSSTTQYLANNGTWQNVPSVPSAATATPSDLGTAAVGSSSKYAKEDHVHNKPTYSASDVGAIAAPASPSVGDFLVYTSNGWAAQSLSAWQGGNY